MPHSLQKAAFLSIALFFPLFSSGIFAQEATVKSVNKKKRSVIIDQGTVSGFAKKTKVCIYNDSDKVVHCTAISKAKKNSAFFLVKSAKILAKIKPDMLVRIQGPAPLVASDRTSASYKEGGVRTPKDAGRSSVTFGYVLTPIAPSTYSKLAYLPPFVETPGTNGSTTYKKADSVDTMWENTGKNSLSVLGLGFEFEYGLSKDFAVTSGLRYRISKTFQSTTDYNMVDPNQYLELTQKGSATGLYFDFQFLNLELTPTIFLRASSGLDYDMATTTFTVNHLVEKGAPTPSLGQIYKASSKLSTLSLRLGSSINLMFLDQFGLHAGFNLLVPIMASGGTPSLDISDPYATSVANPEEDFKQALDHKKSSFGAEVFLGMAITI